MCGTHNTYIHLGRYSRYPAGTGSSVRHIHTCYISQVHVHILNKLRTWKIKNIYLMIFNFYFGTQERSTVPYHTCTTHTHTHIHVHTYYIHVVCHVHIHMTYTYMSCMYICITGAFPSYIFYLVLLPLLLLLVLESNPPIHQLTFATVLGYPVQQQHVISLAMFRGND
jgi:hypothetical protein